MVTQSMRPKWKKDTCYVPTSDGVYLRGNNSRLVLKGKSLYTLLKHLVPHLNGNITLEELIGGLDADRKRMVTNLLEKLFTHQLLQDTSQDQPHTLRPLELETYASGIAFIESFQTSAAYRFECFCNKHLLLIGSGLSLTSLVQASLACGVKKISVIVMPEDGEEPDFSQHMRDLVASMDSEEDTRLLDTLSWNDEARVQDAIQASDAILYIAERPMLARAQLLNRLCIERQKTLLQAILIDENAWIGPLVSPETGACWECAWRRLQVNQTAHAGQLSHAEFQEQPLVFDKRSLSTSRATVIANRLIFGLFQHFTQISPTETAKRLGALDLATCLSESHAFLPHPHCLACQHPVVPTGAQFLEQIQRLQQQGPVDPEMLLENLAPCVDEKLGLFTAFSTKDFVQAPLAVYNVNLSSPRLKEGQVEPLSVIAVSTDTRAARTRVAQKACERYAAELVDRRRLFSPEAAQQLSYPVLSTDQLLETRSLSPEDEMWTWALDLQTQQASLVPASHVFSSSGQQERGLASGGVWVEAICNALLDWCNHLTVEQLQSAHQPYPQVDLGRMSMTTEGQYLVQLHKAAGRKVTVYDITGTLHVPTFAICVDEKVVAYSSHCDEMRALNMGLEQALQQCQSEQFQQPDYAVAPVPAFPANLRGAELSVPHYTLPSAWSARQQWLLEQLQANGLRAFAIPLDHDPALARVSPFIVRVLVGKRELKKGDESR